MVKKKKAPAKPAKNKPLVKKPVKEAKKAIKEAVRVRHNEQNKLYRLNRKFKTTKKKTEADKLRKQIRAQEKTVQGFSKTVTDIRTKAKQIQAEKKEIKSLKLKNAAITRKLNKKYERKQFDKEYKELNNQHIKNTGLIQGRQKKTSLLTYEINKRLGFEPKEIAKAIDIRPKDLQAEFEDDFEDGYFDESGGGYSGGGGEPGEDVTEEIIEDEAEPEEPDEKGFVEEMGDVFWVVWKDFDTNEKPHLYQYDSVVFSFGGGTYRFKGTSLSMASMKAAEMWRFARENGSDTYVVKYVTLDRKKLKYTIDEI